MESQLWAMFCILFGIVAASHATTTSEIYWQTTLPNTAMPKIIKDQLPQGPSGIDSASIKDVNPSVHDTLQGDVHAFNLVYIGDIPQQVSDESTAQLFFVQKDLYPGKNITLNLTRTATSASFLPRRVADAIPFSSTKLADIYKQFSIDPQSAEAQKVKLALNVCETPKLPGETKTCATSLESMIDFVTSIEGKDVTAVTTDIDKQATPKQVYTIGLGVQKVDGADKPVACHVVNYMCTVYYCHSIEHTSVFKVPMVGADGTKVKALAFCHEDTSTWNPNHPVFKQLDVLPGTDPICHFFHVDTLVWLPKPKIDAGANYC